MAQEKQDLSAALHAFETALVLAPARYHAAILDELGVNYYLSQAYQTALGYHMRALQALENEPSSNGLTALQLKIELHRGDDYRALGAYAQARDHYERSRLLLSAEHDMKTAAALYLSLGYCTYAAMYQNAGRVHSDDMPERERQFQRAVGFLVQSRSIYQVSGNQVGEVIARLTQALVLLDLCTAQRQAVQGKSMKTGSLSSIQYMSLLDEAEEQCRQVLLGWQEPPDISLPEQDALLYTTLAYLIRMSIQRAVLARLDGHGDTAFRARARAVDLCQQVLDAFSENTLPWTVLRNAVTLQAERPMRQPLSLPRLPNQTSPSDPFPRSPISKSEVYLAVAEVAEELGRVATKPEFARECYEQANQYMQAALDYTRTVTADRERDPGYFVRCYLRCAALLEERSLVAPDMGEEVVPVLVEILKDGLSSLEDLILPVSSR
jgi:tetratricopeptide (TPR) repeat protein